MIQPSLRDFIYAEVFPSTDVLGYFQAVPAGLVCKLVSHIWHKERARYGHPGSVEGVWIIKSHVRKFGRGAPGL